MAPAGPSRTTWLSEHAGPMVTGFAVAPMHVSRLDFHVSARTVLVADDPVRPGLSGPAPSNEVTTGSYSPRTRTRTDYAAAYQAELEE